MAEKDYSEEAFLAFIKHSVVTGILRPQVARARKQAAEQLITQLKPHERADLRLLDVEDLAARFHKLQGSAVRPETLNLYSSRLRDGLTDFISWRSDPHTFIPQESELKSARAVALRDDPGESRAREELALDPPKSPFDIFSVPIREQHVVYLQNIPLDLTRKEAEKIASVVRALADPGDDSGNSLE
ncbi:MAG: hypothetical protein ACI9GW_003375 [Halieaceae bacterium]|jgi:hypothetical protein